MKRTLGSTVNVYISEYSSVDVNKVDQKENIPRFIYSEHVPEEAPDSWVHVGEADIHIDLRPQADIVKAKVASLRAEIKEIENEAFVKKARTEQAIANLLALEYTPPAAETRRESEQDNVVPIFGASAVDGDIPF
jgi:hypothetical protein